VEEHALLVGRGCETGHRGGGDHQVKLALK
jgi:hypothetical protein